MKIRFFGTVALLALASGAYAGTQSAQYSSYLAWAQQNFYLTSSQATEVADFMDSFPASLRLDPMTKSYLQNLLTQRIPLVNGDPAKFDATIADLKQTLPPTAKQADILSESQKASMSVAFYNSAKRNLGLSDDRAIQLIDTLRKYDTDTQNSLIQAIEKRASVDGVENLDAIVTKLTKDLPNDPTAKQVASKELSTAQLYSRTYTQAQGLPPDLAKRAADLVDAQSPDGASAMQNKLYLLFRSQNVGRTEIVSALDALSKDPNQTITIDSKPPSKSWFHSDQYVYNITWAKSQLYLPDEQAVKVADLLDSYPERMRVGYRSYFTEILQDRLRFTDGSKAQVESVLDYIRKVIPTTASNIEIGQEYSRAQALSSTYDWARNTLYLDDSDARKLVSKLMVFDVTTMGTIKSTIQARFNVDGIDKLDSFIDQITKDASDRTSVKPLQNDLIRAQYYSTTYSFASRSNLPSDLSHRAATLVDSLPLEKQPEALNHLQSLIQQQSGRDALESGLANLSKYPDWVLSPDGSKVMGCAQKSLIDKDYQKTLPLESCIKSISTRKYKWADKSQRTCGAFTEGGALLEQTNVAFCSDPIVADILPCLKTLPQDYRFYHFTSHGKINFTKSPGMSDDDAIQNHAQLWASHALESHRGGNTGLYTATDPIETRSYAGNGDDLFLYRIEVPEGTNYLALGSRGSNNSSCQFSPESIAKLQAAGCPTDLNHLVEGEYNPLPGPNCFPLMKKVFKTLNLRGWSYAFGSTSLAGCENRNADAYVWIDLDDLPKNSVQLFHGAAPAPGSPARTEAVEIERLYNSAGASLWPELKADVASKKGRPIDTIKGEDIMGCENLRPQLPPAARAVACDQPGNGLETTQQAVDALSATVNGKKKRHQ